MWFKVDDKLHDHKKVRRCDDLAAMGLWTLAGSWAGDNGTDGFVPSAVLRRWSTSAKRLAQKLVDAGLWCPSSSAGETGFQFVNWAEWQPTTVQAKDPVERQRWRRGKALLRNRELCEAIVARDRAMCRYCGHRVNFSDKRGKLGGTYDHVDPDGDNTLGNVVVACRACNGKKKDRTPDEAGMVLLPDPAGLGPGQIGGQVGSGSGQSPDSALTHAPTRGGTGQVRAGSDSWPGQIGAGQVEAGPFDDEHTSDGRNTAA